MISQKTISKELAIKGIRQSDGKETFVKFLPSESGLWVKYRNLVEPVSPYIMNSNEKRFTNSIVIGESVITMVEHIFSAVHGLGIDNIIVEFDSDEAPFYADSESFSKTLSGSIVHLEDKEKEFCKINEIIEIQGENGQCCKITPADDFIVDITIDFEGIIGRQSISYSHKQSEYLEEISAARSMFAFEISNGNNPWENHKIQFDSFPHTVPDDPKDSPYIAYTNTEFLTPLKDPLEPVKHKLLDFIGDIMLLGKTPHGRFELYKPGHALNREIVRTLFNLDTSWSLQFEYFSKKIPEISVLKNYVENNSVHKNEDVLTHTKNVFKNTVKIINRYNLKIDDKDKFIILLATFLHDYGKKETLITNEDGTTSCPDHEKVSADCIIKENLLERFNLTDDDKKRVLSFIRDHAEIHKIFAGGDSDTRENLEDFKIKYTLDYILHLIFGIADLKDSYFQFVNKSEYDHRIEFLNDELRVVLYSHQ